MCVILLMCVCNIINIIINDININVCEIMVMCNVMTINVCENIINNSININV